MEEETLHRSRLHGSLEVLHSFQVTEEMENVDRACKELYKNKQVLAIILKGVAREFENYKYEEITVNLHFDIEPQTTYRPGYPIEKRGLYYLARELSAQLSLVTENTDYRCLEKRYSIWICRDDVPRKERFSISFFEFSNTLNYGECHPRKDDYDLLTLVIIRLGDKVFRESEKAGMPAEKDEMMEFLHAIMYPHTQDFLTTVKKYIDFSENEELWKESDNMTGLGMSIAKESGEEGWQSGLEEGRLSGLEEGRLEREQSEKLLAEKDAIIDNLKRQLGEHL